MAEPASKASLMLTIDFSGDSASALAGCSVVAIGDSVVVIITFHLIYYDYFDL